MRMIFHKLGKKSSKYEWIYRQDIWIFYSLQRTSHDTNIIGFFMSVIFFQNALRR